MLESYAVACRVITVGNITVGGTGKTPTVCLLARSLREKGFRVCVVNRGYLGARTAEPLVFSDGAQVLAGAADAGDEAVMLARKLAGIPVIACRDRVAAGNLACEKFQAQAVLLDDGFQHLRLRRDLDVVLINAADPFGNGNLLPRGILREPLSALKRAGIIVLTKADSTNNPVVLAGEIHRLQPEAGLFTATYRAACLRSVGSGATLEPGELSGKKVAALCGIGDPESFTGMLERLGMQVVERLTYPDHHAFGAQDYSLINAVAARVEAMVTTEKDIAKLDAGMLQVKNMIVMEIEQVIEPADRFIEEVLTRSGLR